MIDLEKLRTELDLRKVAVFHAAESSWLPIPVALTPTTIDAHEWEALEHDARLVMGVFKKLLRWLQRPVQHRLAKKLFAGLTDFEGDFVNDHVHEHWGHVTVRMDLFWHHGEIKIIEVNCTIPAMQAYSDNVFYAWAKAGGLIQGESKNSKKLLDSLVAMYRLDGGLLARPRIIILHREGDSQLGELLWFQQEWNAHGFETYLADPLMLSRMGDVWVVNEIPCDLIYRHIFAFRLSDHVAGEELRRNQKSHIYNPVSAHFEAKAFLALVSQVADDQKLAEEVDMTEEEITSIKKRVPHSRILGGDEAFRSLGANQGSLRDRIESKLEHTVLKRSIGYGGHQVIMGNSWFTEETQEKLRNLTNLAGMISFEDFFKWVSDHDDSLWITQERMSGAQRKTQVLTSQGLDNWDAWFDASIYINTRTAPICRGGVSRISKSPVVNIGTGGGLAPFMIVSNGL